MTIIQPDELPDGWHFEAITGKDLAIIRQAFDGQRGIAVAKAVVRLAVENDKLRANKRESDEANLTYLNEHHYITEKYLGMALVWLMRGDIEKAKERLKSCADELAPLRRAHVERVTGVKMNTDIEDQPTTKEAL